MNLESSVSMLSTLLSVVLPLVLLIGFVWLLKKSSRSTIRLEGALEQGKRNLALVEQLVELQKETNSLLRQLVSQKEKIWESESTSFCFVAIQMLQLIGLLGSVQHHRQ